MTSKTQSLFLQRPLGPVQKASAAWIILILVLAFACAFDRQNVYVQDGQRNVLARYAMLITVVSSIAGFTLLRQDEHRRRTVSGEQRFSIALASAALIGLGSQVAWVALMWGGAILFYLLNHWIAVLWMLGQPDETQGS